MLYLSWVLNVLNYAAHKGKEVVSEEVELDEEELENLTLEESHEGSVRSGPKLMSDAMKKTEGTSPKRGPPDGDKKGKKDGKKPKNMKTNELMKLKVQSFI